MVLVLIIMCITLMALIVGVIFMSIGGKLNQKYSNKLMVIRVVAQALAVALLLVFSFFFKHG